MSLTTPYQRIFYTSDGATSIYSFPFDGISKDYIRVNVKHTNGTIDNDVNIEIPLQVTGQMVGTIVFPAGQIPESGAVIMIERVTPLSQNVNYANQIQFSAAAIDSSFDKLQAQIQEITDRLNTSSVGTSAFQEDSFNFALMTAANQNQYLQLDYANKTIKGGLFMELASGNRYRVSANGSTWYYLPRSNDIQEIRMTQLQNPTRNVLQYRVGNTWYTADFIDLYYTKSEIDAKESALSNRINTNKTTIDNHLANYSNPHRVTKGQVGLGNVDNTSDLSKPVSNATSAALATKQNKLIAGRGITIDGNTINATGIDVQIDSEFNPNSGNPVKNSTITSTFTNCIIKTPQDIKLELANGVLTLKAGSKCYKVDGTTITTPRDVTTSISANGQYFLYLESSTYIARTYIDTTISSATEPENPTNLSGYFNTTTNKVYKYSGGWVEESLPFAMVTVSDGAISSIDQVFNGLGCLGATEFVLPGVTVLIPSGRNADGTLSNIKYTTSQVATLTIGGNKPIHIAIRNNGTLGWWEQAATRYDANQNLNYYNKNRQYYAVVGKFDVVNGRIQNFTPYNTFHAVDYNDTDFIANQAMPGTKSINLTSSVSDGYTFTAPDYGWVYFGKRSSASGQHMRLHNVTTGLAVSYWSSDSAQLLECMLPVSKGQNVRINYTLEGTNNGLLFYYANGAK